VMDTYALEKLERWTPELAPPKDSPLFRWRVLAGMQSVTVVTWTQDRDRQLAKAQEETQGEADVGKDRRTGADDFRTRGAG